jgi:hypothetical protein
MRSKTRGRSELEIHTRQALDTNARQNANAQGRRRTEKKGQTLVNKPFSFSSIVSSHINVQ